MQAFLIAISILAVCLAAALVAAILKIRDMKRSQRRLDDVDGMTGLLLRDSFLEEGGRLLEKYRAEGKGAALIIFDVDGLGKINTLFGNEMADSVVTGFAKAVQNVSQGRFPCGRVDTDDFALLISFIEQSEVDMYINAFRDELNNIFSDTAVMKRADFYAGVVIYDGCDDIYTMHSKANLCMLTKSGGRVTYFATEMEERLADNEFMRAEMLAGLEKGEFEQYYQPKICIKTGRIMGVEALTRWHHPTKGFIPPGEFILLAEQTGLITKLDEWGLRTACRQAKQWVDQGLPPVKISVNMSQAQFYCTDVIQTVNDVLEDTGLDPALLEIEVTETMAMKDIDRTISVLESIRSMGVSVSMDDFGSGYSSLSSLKSLPLDILKIDRSLVCDIDENDVSQQITGAIVSLGKAMKLIVLAEGVETQAQCEYLSGIGCDLAQGYYYSKPRPAAEITAMLIPFMEKQK